MNLYYLIMEKFIILLNLKYFEKKYKFKTNSDTEVLLYSWKEWGTKVFSKLNGMYAL